MVEVLLANNPDKLIVTDDPVHTVAACDAPVKVGFGLTLSVIFWLKTPEQFGVALVTVIPVMRSVCPLLAAESTGEVKLAFPEAFAVTPVTGVWATPLME